MEIIPQKNKLQKLTIEDKIVLLLLDLNFYQNKQIVPEMLTEHGLQKVLSCSIGLVSQILTKLKNDGLVFRKLMKIKNKHRKQCAFFLTEQGLEYALELRKDVGEFKPEIIETNYTQKKLFEYYPVVKLNQD